MTRWMSVKLAEENVPSSQRDCDDVGVEHDQRRDERSDQKDEESPVL
jgi:hypothetical protein